MSRLILTLFVGFYVLNFVEGGLTYFNQTASHREKRVVVFERGGVSKMVFGAIYPLYLEDKVKWRQVNCGYSIQAQYDVPRDPLYWWERWEGRTLLSARKKFDQDGTYIPDESRLFVYTALETFMSTRGKNGRKCLLRAICENAEVNEHHGIFAEILNVILTPGKSDVHSDYRDAYEAGKSGMNCEKLFRECPKGHGFMDSIAVTFSNWI